MCGLDAQIESTSECVFADWCVCHQDYRQATEWILEKLNGIHIYVVFRWVQIRETEAS